MNPKSLQSPKASYAAAFLLGALIALLFNWPSRGADLSPVGNPGPDCAKTPQSYVIVPAGSR